MQSLFPIEPSYPEGFRLHPDFISFDKEHELLHEIAKTELHTFMFQGFEAKRRVASFGYDYSFDQKMLKPGKPIPVAFQSLVGKTAMHLGLKAGELSELLVTEYPPGSVINWHRDAPPFDLIAGISLLSDCRFRLRPYDKKKQGRRNIVTIDLQRRSLYVMQGAARQEWEHSISPVKETRFSITLRTLRK
jgi:alkylated DNA repair dioxygenase AlkB